MSSEESNPPERHDEAWSATVHVFDGVNVYARADKRSRPANLDAIDQNEKKIRDIADILFRRGFGVMRTRSARAGKVFYLLKASWSGAGEPPCDPFAGH